MNYSGNKAQYNPHHKRKCYCQVGNYCSCTGLKSSTAESSPEHKFIKVHRDRKPPKSDLFCGFNSCSTSSLPTSVSTSSLINGIDSLQPRLTERRELYERSKETLNQPLDVRLFEMPQESLQSEAQLICDDKIAKLQEFRLRNSDECLSTCSRFSMDRMNRLKNVEQIAEVTREKYKLNKRGLLESYDNPVTKTKNGTPVAVIVDPTSAATDILRQKLKTSKEKNKFLRKALCLPENSLALRYQKTY